MGGLTFERANELLCYAAETGVLTWRVDRVRAKAGNDATQSAVRGYRKVKVDRTYYQAHRVAWLLANGSWPSMQIDHINGTRSDNRLVNLRDVSCRENQKNRRGKFAIGHAAKQGA